MRGKREKLASGLLSGVFLSIGVIFFVSGILWMVNILQFRSRAVEVYGQIERIETSWDSDGESSREVYITYTYNGKTYNNVRINTYTSSMYEGKKITLFCDPYNSGRVELKSTLYLAPVLFIVIGAIFSLVGGWLSMVKLIKAGKKRRLIRQGLTLYATVEEISRNTGYSVNGKHPFVIYCSYRDEYKDVTYRFKSENLWTDPSSVFPEGSTIPVLVDGENYSQYYVNTEEMQKKIVDYT